MALSTNEAIINKALAGIRKRTWIRPILGTNEARELQRTRAWFRRRINLKDFHRWMAEQPDDTMYTQSAASTCPIAQWTAALHPDITHTRVSTRGIVIQLAGVENNPAKNLRFQAPKWARAFVARFDNATSSTSWRNIGRRNKSQTLAIADSVLEDFGKEEQKPPPHLKKLLTMRD